jgi:carboxymethylenebutenolidase
MTEAEIKRRAIALFDRYTHETPNRRAFLAEMTKLAGSAAAASALIATIAPSPAAAALSVASATSQIGGDVMAA